MVTYSRSRYGGAADTPHSDGSGWFNTPSEFTGNPVREEIDLTLQGSSWETEQDGN